MNQSEESNHKEVVDDLKTRLYTYFRRNIMLRKGYHNYSTVTYGISAIKLPNKENIILLLTNCAGHMENIGSNIFPYGPN